MNEIWKLDEARYFLDHMRQAEAASDELAFNYELSAFLSAARSVLQYAFKQAESMHRQEWYREIISADPLLHSCVIYGTIAFTHTP